MKRDFLAVTDLSRDEHRRAVRAGGGAEGRRRAGEAVTTLAGRSLLLLFEKASTRTRLSFEAAIGQLGGNAITLPTADSQIARGEPLADTARVISRYVDAIMFRTHGDERLARVAAAATVPVINGLSDGGHPVQMLADLFTVEEKLGSVAGKRMAFVGDCASQHGALVRARRRRSSAFKLRLAAPEGYRPPTASSARAGSTDVTRDPQDAGAGADVVITDVWTSMGQEAEAAARLQGAVRLPGGRGAARARAPSTRSCCTACRPTAARRSPPACWRGRSRAVFDEAENRLHVQKALLEKIDPGVGGAHLLVRSRLPGAL